MECAFSFEDSVFSETRERSGQKGLSYTAKRCEPQWFNQDLNRDDVGEVHTLWKFRADLSYRQKHFEKAFNEYNDCYALIPLANNAMRRDVQESQARCLLQLGRYKEALKIAEMLTGGVSNTDHLTGALHLQATIHNHLGNLEEEVSCLQQLISLHPFNPQFWICLAEAYKRLFLNITNSKDPSQSSNRVIATTIYSIVSRDSNSAEQLWMWSCASFIRTRLLLQFIQPQHASFVLENNMKTQERIEKQLEKSGLLEEHKRFIVEVMSDDLLAERTEEGQPDIKTTQTLSSFIMPSDVEFKDRWFQKINTLLVASEKR